MHKYFQVSLILMQAFALNLNMGESTDINQCPSTGPALWLSEPSIDTVNPEEERACDYEDEQNMSSEERQVHLDDEDLTRRTSIPFKRK